jgi:hypothetical protein
MLPFMFLILHRCNIAANVILIAIFLQNFVNEIFCINLLSAAQRCQMAFCHAADKAVQSDALSSLH